MRRSFSLASSLIAPSLLALAPGFASGVAWASETPVPALPLAAATATPAPGDEPQSVAGVEIVAKPNPQKNGLGLSTSVSGSIQDTPQLVSVVPKELLKDQRITTLEQALRDVPGITVAIGEGGTLAGDQFKIRGLDANNDIYTDGLRDFGVYTRDAFDYEEVQILKGPSGAMFGRGSTGGAINTISKQPQTRGDFLHLETTIGNGDYYRLTADANHRINDTTAVRLNVFGNSTGIVDRDRGGHSDRGGFAAIAGFGLGTDKSFTLNLLHQSDDRNPDYGLVIGAPTNVIKALPVSEYGVNRRTYEQYTTDHDRTRADILTGRFSWTISPSLTLSSDTRAASYDRYFQYTSVDSCLVNAATKQTCVDALIDNNSATLPLITFGGGSPYSQRAWGFQNITSLRGTLNVYGFKNEFVAGTDFNRQQQRKAFFAYTLPPLSSGLYAPGTTTAARNALVINLLTGAGAPPAGYSVFRPTARPGVAATGIPLTNITTATYITDSTGDAFDAAGFVTDRIWLTPQVSVIAGARYDAYGATFTNLLINGVRQTFKTPSHLTSPRISLVYEPSSAQTYYASYGKSSTPVGSGIVGTATPIAATTQAFAPDEGETFEFGAKGALFGSKLGWDAAYFHVNKSNAKMFDPASGQIDAQSSQKQTLQGVELGATGKITDAWSINLAYTYIDSEVRQDLACTTVAPLRCFNNPATTGTPVVQVPRNSAFAWTSYDLRQWARGLSVAGGVTYQDGFFVRYTTTGTTPNLTLTRAAYVPDSFSLDCLIRYETRRYEFAVNFYNLTDRLNYSQSFGNRAVPAQGRTVLFTAGVKF